MQILYIKDQLRILDRMLELIVGVLQLRTDDQLGQAIHRNVLRIVSTLCLTETDNRDTVTDLHDFIQLMGDKYDRMSRLTELLQLFKQRLGLLRSQHGRRLIENDDLRIPVKCL